LTVACLADDDFILFGSGAAQDMHRRWFEQHIDSTNVRYENQSDHLHGIAISGPLSRELLAKICRDDVSADAFCFRDVRQTFVADVPALLVHLSFSGELGFEIYVAPQYQYKLYEILAVAGEASGIVTYGAKALMSLRLEKSWGAWTLDYRPDYTAAESGLDKFIHWDKDFIGKAAALAERTSGPARRLVTLVVDTEDIDVSGDEAVLVGDDCVGHVTSGGYAHHARCSVAMAYVTSALAQDGALFDVEICGARYAAKLIENPLLS
jgi:dimethylglycine dehydrogenase